MTSAAGSRGVDENGTRKPAFNLTPTGGEPITKGKLVAFYAAQTVETTPEMPLPKGTTDAPRFGLFTFTILSKLAENPNVTYRQLGQAVLQQYSADSRTRPTPLFEGELDARVFGTDKTDAVMQWPIVVKDGDATIGAGLLHRLTPGSKLAILPSALSPLSDAVGYLEVQSAKNLESRVKPVEFDKKPALKVADIPANAYARVAEIAVDYKLIVARPAATKGLEKETALVNSVLDELATAKETGFNIELVDPGKSAELRFAVMRENAIAGAAKDATDKPALWFLPASGDVTLKDGSKPPLVIIHMDDRQKLVDATTRNLRTIFRATGLSRLAAASDYKPEDVDVQFQVKRRDKDGLEPLQASVVPRVSPGDEVHVLAKNGSDQLVDINVLYVGSDYSITHIVAERLASAGHARGGVAGLHRHQLRHGKDDRGADRGAAGEREGGSELPGAGRRRVDDTRLGACQLLRHADRYRHGAGNPLGDAACRQERPEGRGDDLPDGDGATRLSRCRHKAGSCAIGAI